MTTPASSGGRSPLRVAGIALLAVGILAGLTGAITLATNGSTSNTAAPPPPATTTVEPTPAPPSTTEPAPSPTPAVPVPSFAPTPPPGALPTPPPPGANAPKDQNAAKDSAPAPEAAAPKAAAPAGAVEKAPLRVYSNGTIHGIAGRAAEDFRQAGWQVERVDNYSSGVIPTSTAYYRPGTSEQAAAQALGSQFGLRVEPRFAGLTEASPGIIVIITNDYKQH